MIKSVNDLLSIAVVYRVNDKLLSFSGNLTLYDTSDVEHAGAPLHRSLLKVAAPGEWGPHALVASPDDRRVAFVGPNEFTITVSASATLDELLRVDVSSGFKAEPDILSLR